MERKTRKIFTPISILVLSLAFFSIWFFYFKPEVHNLRISFFDVGQGDSALITFPDGKNALIDGGPDKKVLEKLGGRLPFYKRKLDAVFLSHPDADHVTGLVYVLKRYRVGRVVMVKNEAKTPEYEEFNAIIRAKKIPVTEAVTGTEIDFGNRSTVKILYPQVLETKKMNDNSEVILLNYGSTNLLFTGDLEKDAEDYLSRISGNLKIDVLKVPHHGSKDALSDELYNSFKPRFAVISVGANNKYGHPSREVTDFLSANRISFFRTDKDGDVDFESDGKGIYRK